ncbi:MAG: Acetyltransferase family [Ilumatobacteraceae bacterium]|nr:Acetyltransferase family [Ilumatobacteraceae bacterium]
MDVHGIADIDLLAVDPNLQGRGIATTLNNFAFQRSQEASMAHVVVATADDPGHAPARRSYENAGFVPMPIQWTMQIIRLSSACDR